MRKGRNFSVMSTIEVKLVATSEWKVDRSKFTGSDNFIEFWVPALSQMQSKLGYCFVMLASPLDNASPGS